MEMDFMGLIRMYHTQALIYIGKVKNPMTDAFEPNLPQAKLLIDILEVLEEKTLGNLTEQEAVLLNESINYLKTNFPDNI